jgi:hypothetical protein
VLPGGDSQDSATARLVVADLVRALTRAMTGWRRSSLLHFLLAGALLFGAERGWDAYAQRRAAASPYAPIVFSAQQVDALRSGFSKRWGRPPTQAALEAMIREAADDEALCREARRLGLDRNDASVRLRLIQKARAVSASAEDEEELYQEAIRLGFDDDIVIKGILKHKMLLLLRQEAAAAPASDDEIRSYIEAHRARFAIPPTVSFAQVFLGAAVHGANFPEDARALLARLRAGSLSPEHAERLSDPFTLGLELFGQSRTRLGQLFGADFAAALFELPADGWNGPIASPFGLHLIRVRARTVEEMPPIDTLRPQVSQEIAEERAERQMAIELARLRSLYPVVVMDGDLRIAAGSAVDGAP